jgi:hypothetical protein
LQTRLILPCHGMLLELLEFRAPLKFAFPARHGDRPVKFSVVFEKYLFL